MGRVTSPRGRMPALGAIVAVGLILRLWGITWGLADATVSTRAHPDEWTVYWLFRWFDGSHSLNPCPSAGSRCFFDWGSAFPYAAYIVHWLAAPIYWFLPAASFGSRADLYFVHAVLTGRLVSVVLSTATIVIAYKLASSLHGYGAGLIAALIVALSGLLIQLAHFATPDSTTLFLLSLAVFAILHAHRSPDVRAFLLAGAAIGAACASEFHMALLALPLLTAWLLIESRRATWLAASAAAALLVFLALNPYILVEFPSFLAAADHSLRMRTVDSAAQYGDRFDGFGPGWLYVARYALGYGVGYALTVWLILGAAVAVFRRRPADLILLAWIAPYFLLISVVPAKFMRYSAPLLIPLAILAARASIELLGRSGRARRATVSVLLVGALLYSAAYDAAYAGLFASPDPRLSAARWIAENAPSNAEIAYDALPDGLLNLPYFVAASGHRSCFSATSPGKILGAPYVALDDYAFDEATTDESTELRVLRSRLARSHTYSLVDSVRYTPTFLGLSFPIQGSPHDWRYPTHNISVYRLDSPQRSRSISCVANPARARSTVVVGAALGR